MRRRKTKKKLEPFDICNEFFICDNCIKESNVVEWFISVTLEYSDYKCPLCGFVERYYHKVERIL